MSQPTNAWDQIFKQQGRVFAEPHPDMPGIARWLKGRGARKILDLGSGTGRHVVTLARHGFTVFGIDASPEGIRVTRQLLVEEGLEAALHLGSMTEPLPYGDAAFDVVVSVQVIHHAELATIRKIVQEIRRVLKRGGFLFVTVPRLRNQGLRFDQVESNTFIPLDGPERGLPHHYFTPMELRAMFGEFEIVGIHLDTVRHYCLSAFER